MRESMQDLTNQTIIGCDIGLKRIGLAKICNGIILPLAPLLRKNRNQAAQELSKLLIEQNPITLVVGMPSQNLEMQKRIKHFISLVAFDGQIIYINEDNTSLEALESLCHFSRGNKINAQKNGKLDSLAACKILERYIANITNKSEL